MGSVARMPRARGPRTIAAASRGSRLTMLVALRNKVAAEIDAGVPPAYLAPLVRQLRDLGKEIAALKAVENEGDDVGLAAATPDAPWAG